MRMKTFLTSLALIALIITVSKSQAVRESFDYPLGTYLDGAGTAGHGWAGPWYIHDSSWNKNSQMLTIADTGTQYNDLINFPIHRTGHQAVGNVPAGWSYIRYGRFLDHQWTNTAGNIYWLSFAFDLKWGSVNCWADVALYDSTNNRELFGAPHGWGNDTVTLNGVRSTFSTANGPQWYVMRMDMKGDSLARLFLWVSPNPDGGQPDTSEADIATTYNFIEVLDSAHGYARINHNGFNAVHLEFSNEVAGTEAMYDEVRLGTSWADVSSTITSVESGNNIMPSQYALPQNYPNPFNPTTQIAYAIPQTGYITLKVYNILGDEVTTLYSGVQSAGNHAVTFSGSGLSSGIYFYRLQAGNKVITNKMMLLK